jgi:formylglycine-generating enzyme required for sulfatase activity
MVYPAGTNTANFDNCANWNGESGNLTTVGANGGPSSYGTYDQAGNIDEWTGEGYSLGGSYSSSADELTVPTGPITDPPNTSLVGLGFRIAGQDYADIAVSFQRPNFYTAGSQLNHSIKITNNESFPVSLEFHAALDPKVTSNSWTISYGINSSGISSGSSSAVGSMTLAAGSFAVINMVSQISSLATKSIVFSIELFLEDGLPKLSPSVFSTTILSSLNTALNYSQLFSGFSDWNSVSPNSFVLIDDAGNTPVSGIASVPYNYLMTKYEITNIEYCLFLNSVDPEGLNPQEIYNSQMEFDFVGGILYSSSEPNGAKYSLKPNMGNKPVNFVSWWSAARYCNWLHNGALSYQTTSSDPSAPQNDGAYTVSSFTFTFGPVPSANSGAKFTIPVIDEWVKAAYYSANSLSGAYNPYATQYSEVPSSVTANITTGDGIANVFDNSANWQYGAFWDPGIGFPIPAPTTVGTNGAPSAYGLFDMNGNVAEIIHVPDSAFYKYLGGSWNSFDSSEMLLEFIILNSDFLARFNSDFGDNIGFRVVSKLDGDISVSSTVSSEEYIQNNDITITLTIQNNSSYDVDYNNLLIDVSGPEFNEISWLASYPETSSSPPSGTSSSINSEISIGAGDTIVYVFTIKTIENTITPISFVASVVSPELFSDTSFSNNSTTQVINPKPTNLNISLDGPLEYSQLETITYDLIVKNIGDTYIENVGVLLLSSGALLDSFIWSAQYSGASGEASGINGLYTSLSILPSGEVIYSISLTPSATTIDDLVLEATLLMPSGLPDTDLSDNEASFLTKIRPTDLSINIDTESPYTQQIPLPVIVEINNTGQYSPSTNLNVSFSGASYESLDWTAIYSSGSFGPVSGIGNIVTSGLNLANSGSAIFQISYIPEIGSVEPLMISGTVLPKDPLLDSDLTNNTFIAPPVYVSPIDLSISASGDELYQNGQIMSYNFTITNNSPNAVSGIVLNSLVPIGVSSLRWTAVYFDGEGPNTGSGTINSSFYLASSGFAVYGIDTVTQSGILYPIQIQGGVNLPVVSGLIDPDLSNNNISLEIQHAIYIENVFSSKSSCGDNGQISISIGGGAPPFTYSIGDISFTSSDRFYKFTELSPGEYNVTIIDNTNSIIFFPETIIVEDAKLEIAIDSIFPPALLDSFGLLKLSVTCKRPFSIVFIKDQSGENLEIPAFDTKYLISKEDNTFYYRIDDLLTPGQYEIIVIDDQACSITENIVIPNAQPMSVNISVIPDDPIIINSPLLSLDIVDTILVPYHHIRDNSSLWQLIKNYNLKDKIYLWINDERYEFKVVRTMLDKYCLNENKIEILKLGNFSEDWYFYIYIAPSINFTTNPELIGARIQIGSDDGPMFDIVLGLSDDGQLEQDRASLIRGSMLLDGIVFPDINTGFSANISIGVSDVGLASNDFVIENITKRQLRNIYQAGIVTSINFLENTSVLNEYINIGQTTCNTSPEDYRYLLNIKSLLLAINNLNNLGNIYVFNAKNIISTGQVNCFANIETSILTENGNIDNSFTTEYFTFDSNSKHFSKFIVNNNELKDVGVISGIDSRYVIARIKDNYNNHPNSIVYDSGITVNYDSHFVKSKQILQQVNSQIVQDFKYGDVLIFVPKITQDENEAPALDPNPQPVPPQQNLPPTINAEDIPVIEISKDTSNTSTLITRIFPKNTKCNIYGPKNYYRQFIGDVVFTNIIPGVYKIVGETEDLKNKNLYQNEYRIIIDKNTSITQAIEFFSYANKLFIRKDH